MAITGSRYVWREHVQSAGDLAAIAALAALAAGYSGAQLLVSLRGRRLPGDEVLPSALPFTLVLAGTAGWLLPLCYLHPTTLFASAPTITWAAVGTLGTAVLFGWAWRATRVPPPRPAEVPAELPELDGEVFLSARFLKHTDYNPHGFGTHIALGDGPPAVTRARAASRHAGSRRNGSPSGRYDGCAATTATPCPAGGTSPNSTTGGGWCGLRWRRTTWRWCCVS
ncbi:hypothetical protein ACGFY7_08205 [Streptomyces prunicolor]|uniref:hypothetical protein n=1 Tax=Streptomyces prunicolor TaxID=67348 RepID=UPI003717B079